MVKNGMVANCILNFVQANVLMKSLIGWYFIVLVRLCCLKLINKIAYLQTSSCQILDIF
jgi:hypothetical protein